MKKSILFLLFAVCNMFAQAQFVYSPACQQAHCCVLNLDFDSVATINISNNSSYWIDAYSVYVGQIANNQNVEAQNAIQKVAASIASLQATNDNSPELRLALADMWLMKSVLFFQKSDYVSAATAYYKSLRYVDDSNPLALKHRLTRTAVERLMLNLMPYSSKAANAQLFVQHCQSVATFIADSSIAQPFKVELCWLFFTVISDANVDATSVANVFAIIPNEWFLRCPLLTVSAYKVAVKYGLSNYAQQLMQCILSNRMDKKIASANMLIGNHLIANASDSCMRYFDASKQSSHMYVAMKKAWAHFIQSRTDSADAYIDAVLAIQPQTESDYQAKYECSLRKHWHPQLMKARVLFDAAYFEQAKILLDSVDVSALNNIQTAEYNYRMARILTTIGNVDEAKQYYQKVVKSGTDAELYYPAYSAYYLGIIYKQEGNKEKSNEWFKLCHKTNSPIYSESIHRKAKWDME